MKETSLLGLRVACYSVIAGCLLFEGAILAFMGFPYWVTWHIFVTGCFWVLTCIAAVFETMRSTANICARCSVPAFSGLRSHNVVLLV